MRVIDRAGIIRRYAGNYFSGILGFTSFSGDGNPAVNATLSEVKAVFQTAAGDVYIADGTSGRIRVVDRAGIINSVAGGEVSLFADTTQAIRTPLTMQASTADASGVVHVYDPFRCRLYRVTADGKLQARAGNGVCNLPNPNLQPLTTPFWADSMVAGAKGDLYYGAAGYLYKLPVSGPNEEIGPWYLRFNDVTKVAVDESRATLYLIDGAANLIYKILPGAVVQQIALNLARPTALAVDSASNVYIANMARNQSPIIHRITPAGVQTAVAGNGLLGDPISGARALESPIAWVSSITFDSLGALVFADHESVYRIAADGILHRIAGGGQRYAPDNILATAAGFSIFMDSNLAADSTGNIYFTPKPALGSLFSLENAFGSVMYRLTPAPQVRCTWEVDRTSCDSPASGDDLTLNVTASQDGCFWTASSDSAWASLTLTSAWRSGSLRIRVAANTATSARTATLAVAGKTVTVKQAAAAPAIPTGPALASSAAIVNAATFQAAISPGSWFTIKGERFASLAAGRIWRPDEITGDRLPTQLEGVRVNVNGKPVAIYYVSSTQINAQAADDEATGDVPVEVITPLGKASGRLLLLPVAPGLFIGTSDPAQNKLYPAATIPNSYTYVGRPELLPGVDARPARPGEYVALWGTGFGLTTPVTRAGFVVNPAPLANRVTATLGGLPCEVQYSGLASAGLNQINIRIRDDISDGEHELILTVAGQSTQARVFLVVRR